MRHDWIFDVLRDLRAYAQTNGLPALALKAQEALDVAVTEIAALPPNDSLPDPEGNESALRRRAH